MTLTQNQKYIIAGLIIVIVAALLIWLRTGNDEGNSQTAEQEQSQFEEQNGSTQDSSGAMQNDQSENTFEGTLKISNDLKRGNLMLDTGERTIYVFTSRDYSDLIGKEVNLEIQGTLDNFTLVDIKAK